MENDVKKNKLGPGIIILSVIFIVGQVYSLISFPGNLARLDDTNNTLISMGLESLVVTRGEAIFSTIVGAIILIGVILILLKKGIGVYIFAGAQVVSIVTTMITKGFAVTTLIGTVIGLIPAGLYLYFISKKKHLFFNK